MTHLALKMQVRQFWVVEDQWPCNKDKGSDIVPN